MGVLYQYSNCPFCNVARASLDFAGVPYVMVDVSPLLKQQVTFTAYKQVPIAILNGSEVHDSAFIVDYLEDLIADAESKPDFKLYAPETEETRIWRQWAYGRFVHVLSPNIYRTVGEAF